MDGQSTEGVSPHDGDHLLPCEVEVVLEELHGLPSVPHDVRVDFRLVGDVGPVRVSRDAVRSARPQLYDHY